MTPTDKTIIVCGSGLAASMTAMALANGLSETYQILLVEDASGAPEDILYGSVSAPNGYDFYRSLGLDEPTLFLRSGTSFSFGTRYENWPSLNRDWMQCHHQPLPVLAGVPLQHHLVRNSVALEPLLISAIAARNGKFAHPPEDPSVPLSRAEYGYQFSVQEWAVLLQTLVQESRVEVISDIVEEVFCKDGKISGLRTQAGKTLSASLYIDCSGANRLFLQAVSEMFITDRSLSATHSTQRAAQLGPPCRVVEASPSGWRSQTFLQESVSVLSVTSPTVANKSDSRVDCALGRVKSAWVENCVAIGHAAGVLEPLTPAPMIMLQRDIERLLELIPVSVDMTAERREFNRRFDDDIRHSAMFGAALYNHSSLPDAAFWSEAELSGNSESLNRKIAQFESRGLLVKYDLEPFNDEDWTILHNGLGRRPARHDLQVERVSKSEIDQQLQGIGKAVESMVQRMPPHHLYVANMKRYLERQRHA